MFSVAMDNAKMTIANSINVARKLSRKESDGIALHSECSTPQHNHNCPGQDGPGDGRNSDHHEQDKQFTLHTKHPLS